MRNSAAILNQLFSIVIVGIDASSKFLFDMSFKFVSKRNSATILNQLFSTAIVVLDASSEFYFNASSESHQRGI